MSPEIIHHTILDMRARLSKIGSFTPRPSWDLGACTTCQLTRWNHLLLDSPPSQINFLIYWDISLSIPIRELMNIERWVEPREKLSPELACQPDSTIEPPIEYFFPTSLRGLCTNLERYLSHIEIPRYFKDLQFITRGNLRILAMTTREWALAFQA